MKHFWLWAICLALAPLAACPLPASAQAPAKAPSPAAPALTGLVTHISIVGLKNISLGTVQAKMTLKVGDAYTPEAAQKDTDALKSMGVFQATMSVKATLISTGGIDLTYTVAENPLVQSIKFTANTPSGQPTIPAAELMAQMKTRTGEVLNTNILVSDLNNLFNHDSANPGYVLKQGYGTDVSSAINIDPKNGVLTIPLVEYYIKSIEISGSSRIKSADILAQMRTKADGIFNLNTLNEDVSKLYETGDFRTVNFTVNSKQPGEINLKLNVVEQPAATGLLDEKQGKVIPLLYDPPAIAYPIVQVSVNGHAPLPFIADTGTTAPLLLAPWAAKVLGLKPNSLVEKANNFSFSRVAIKSVVLQGLTHASGASFDTREAFVTDWSVLNLAVPRPHIAGVVGMGMLVSATSRFDFAAKTLTIFTAPHPPLLIPGGITLPLRSTSTNVFTVHAVLAPNTSADLVLDTGSNGTQVPLPALSALRSIAVSGSNFTETVDGTVYLCPSARLPSLMLGKAQVLNTPIGTLPSTIPQSLGMNILAGYRMTLDGPNAQLILEPAAHSGRYESGDAALFLKQSGTGWAVKQFEKGSPAQRAGLKAGDKILTVNGADVTGVQEVFCQNLLGGLLGHRVQVTVERGTSKLVPVSWIATHDFDIPLPPIGGLAMQKPLGGSWIILEVIEDCPSDKAGLLTGDTLTKLDGEATATMPLARFAELTKEPAVLVEVERPGVAQPFTVRLTVPK